MSEARRKFLFGLAILLLGGLLIGWLYDRPLLGLFVATATALLWLVRQLLSLERAIHIADFEKLRYGGGVWSQVVSYIDYLQQRGDKHKDRYRILLKEVRKSSNAIPDGAIVLNSEFEIVMCNSAAKSLLGFRRRKDRGQRVDNLLRDPKFSAWLSSGRHKDALEILSPQGEDQWLNCRLVPYGAGQHLLLIRDITERARITKARREFVANASHELRSPLTVIGGYLHTLVDDDTTPKLWQKPIEEMHLQAERMNKIVAELLELSALEAKGQEHGGQRVDICGLLSIARKAYAGQPGIAKIELECNSRAAVLGNSTEIESVITNLLTNAIRHTAADGTVTLGWNCDKDGGVLSVSDTGEGIDPSDVPRVTERFFRVDRGRSRDDGGVGLGLAIVKHALSRHDATLQIDSERGTGSRFSCLFPRQRIDSAELVDLKEAHGST
ncbi:MAG: phosphate regulon sensor histidine kinase PhoR [Woeseiaceae bacterium]